MSPPGSPLVPPSCGWYMPMTLEESRPMRLASCDLWTHFALVSPAPALSGLAGWRTQGAQHAQGAWKA